MKKNNTSLKRVFGPDGKLAEQIKGYRPREGQLEMASAVAQAIQSKEHLVAEAGTGTGKTFAYLVPAILSGQNVVISTATKNLQDQLYHKDLPILRDALAVPFKTALLKGRSNYLCTYRLADATQLGFLSPQDTHALEKIRAWAGKTRYGDISEVSSVDERSPVWPMATSTVDNCLGQDCPDFSECFITKVRRRAQEADVVIVNHHLLCADWSLKDGGFGELLPEADVIIVDEAHQLAETASQFLGTSISARQLNDLAADIISEYLKDALDMQALRSAAEGLQQKVKELRLAFGVSMRRGAWDEVASVPAMVEALQAMSEQIDVLLEFLEPAAPRGSGLDACWKRCQELKQQFETMVSDNNTQGWVRWFETYRHTFVMSRTPIDIATEFQRFIGRRETTWILTSATLTVAKKFDHFVTRIGLFDAATESWESPFDYPNQALFYHPRNLPEPAADDFIEKIVDVAVPVLEASRGRAFFLFTSHRALQGAAELLKDRLEYPLLVQGTEPKTALIEAFKKNGNAVLLGTSSFWEGVDVRGSALSCVIIDKLPFASPGDPVLKARLDSLRRQGENPFVSYQVPAAVIALKQGVGRLIRDVTDRGVFVLCDRRLLKKSYGHQFLDSLPDMKRTRVIEDVQAFFDDEVQDNNTKKNSA